MWRLTTDRGQSRITFGLFLWFWRKNLLLLPGNIHRVFLGLRILQVHSLDQVLDLSRTSWIFACIREQPWIESFLALFFASAYFCTYMVWFRVLTLSSIYVAHVPRSTTHNGTVLDSISSCIFLTWMSLWHVPIRSATCNRTVFSTLSISALSFSLLIIGSYVCYCRTIIWQLGFSWPARNFRGRVKKKLSTSF